MGSPHRTVVLVQLPIPPAGSQPVHGNVPLAAAYLKLLARRRGLEDRYAIELLPADSANRAGDRGLVQAILARRPAIVGFTCYQWNVERTLWVAGQLKQLMPRLQVVLGGPEIAADNAWVLDHPSVDYAVIGEGEQTFVELLAASASGATGCLAASASGATGCLSASASGATGCLSASVPESRVDHPSPAAGRPIPGLWARHHPVLPPLRVPLTSLDEISSPYLEGILDAADEKTMFLETVRGCAFRCKFCYYPKSYDAQYFLSAEKIAANLRHAARRGAREVVLLDPTLNQRPDFAGFLRLLARSNPDRQLTCFGELRGEGIGARMARLLEQANFSEVEIGLQSLDPRAQELMDRRINRRAFERGARAMLDVGIAVRVDLILGLPGDTVDSVRRNIDYLQASGLYRTVQVFNLSILPGTAFRQEAHALGLRYQARPPYYVLSTPTLAPEQLLMLMEEAQDAFGLEYDPIGLPALDRPVPGGGPVEDAEIELDRPPYDLPPPESRALAFTLRLRCGDFDAQRHSAAELIGRVLDDNPHTTLQLLLEPTGDPRHLTTRAFQTLQEACYRSASYLDLFYSLHPNRLLSAKRLVVLLPLEHRPRLGLPWVDAAGQYATLVWRGGHLPDDQLADHEHVVP